MTDAQIINGKGEVVASRTIPGATIFDAGQPDVYTARANGRKVRIVVNSLDPRNSDINVDRFRDEPMAELRVSGRSRIEPWFALVSVALILLLIEWAAYLRRTST
jgi:hypothetical protein